MSDTDEDVELTRADRDAGEARRSGDDSAAANAGQADAADAGGDETPGAEGGAPGAGGEAPMAEIRVPTESDMRALGRRLATMLLPGDLLILTGKLGAGKTTFVQGLGEGLGVERPVTSPTFVLARVHASGRLPLVHADAYRLDSIAEIDDLDLETPAERSVTVVEWGEGLVEDLAEERLEVDIEPLDSGERIVRLRGIGRRWRRAFASA